ncbi:unnamed protein product [Alternaria alternata]
MYYKQIEFRGGPSINIHDDKGKSRPADEDDYEGRPITASESRKSDGQSSVYKVEDLGFEAAATKFPALCYSSRGSDSVISDCLKAVFEERRSRHSSQSQKPSETRCVLLELQDEIEKAFDWSQLDEKEFLPLHSFESIFNPKAIALLLDETYNFATDEELQNKFASIVDRKSGRSRRRTLGVLVLMSKVAHIEHFIRENIWDDELPLERSAKSTKGCIRTRNSGNEGLVNTWSRGDIELFCSYQQMFFVPFFDMRDHRLCSYELQSNIRLPWKVFDHKTNGGFGVVHRVEIHPSHHNFTISDSSVEPVFALKAMEAGDHKTYREELAALEKTCAQVHKEKHLIKLLLTFRHGEKFFLLFEWADGNLGEFWRLHPFRPMNLDDRWAAEQCRGLARAVSRIHGLTTWQKISRSSSFGSLDDAERDWGRHGDIKPENILWFKNYGTDSNLLVISDLGLTRYHSRFSKSFVPRSHIDGCSWAYRPPELDIEERISQKYDIWSLGCVFLEFAVWYLQGHYEVEAFSFQRIDEDLATYDGVKIEKFFNIDKSEDGRREPHLKQVVKDRLRELNNLSSQTRFAKELLYIIEHKMLRCAPDEREKIDVICTDLSDILESILKAGDPDDVAQGLSFSLSQDLAHIRRDDSAPSLRAPSRIISFEELRGSAADDRDLLLEDADDPGLLMRIRSRRLKRENNEHSEIHQDLVLSTDGQGDSEVPEVSTIAATTGNQAECQFSEAILDPERREASREDGASSHVPGQFSPMTEANKAKKHRISQKPKKWLRKHLVHLKRFWKE